MTLEQKCFYSKWNVNPNTKEQRLVLDLRDSNMSWKEIDSVFIALDCSPYSEQWNLKTEETA